MGVAAARVEVSPGASDAGEGKNILKCDSST
jgi:hypothetical protein